MIDELKDTFKHETSDYVGRIEYYEGEVREINSLINYFNIYIDPITFFDFLIVYPKLKSRLEDVRERQHDDGKRYDNKEVHLTHKVLDYKKILIEMNKFKFSNQHKSDSLKELRQALIDIKAGTFALRTTSTQEILNNCVK